MQNLRVIVCVKPVPDPGKYEQIDMDPVSGHDEGSPMVINTVDKHAIEAALQLKEQLGGTVTVVSMAPARAEEVLREGLAMGCDEAVLLSDPAFDGVDILATGRVLASAIKKIGYDLVLTGNESAGGDTGHVVSQLAQLLGTAHLASVSGLQADKEGSLLVKIRTNNGYLKLRARLPLVLGVRRELNNPRSTSLMGIMAAGSKPLQKWGLPDLGLEIDQVGLAGSATCPGKLPAPEYSRRREILAGDQETIVRRLVEIIDTAVSSHSIHKHDGQVFEIVEQVDEKPVGLSLEKAAVVVAGGWGIGSRENWCLLEELASLLGGSVGCTRPALDEGWTAGEHTMIGTSGKTVSPKLYIGAGISGDAHHMVGIKDAGVIIAINNDPKAPIFQHADYGVVADLNEILHPLIASIARR